MMIKLLYRSGVIEYQARVLQCACLLVHQPPCLFRPLQAFLPVGVLARFPVCPALLACEPCCLC